MHRPGHPPQRQHRAGAEQGLALLVLAALAVLLAAADTYVVVLALPDVMQGVGIGLDELQRATPIISLFLLGYVSVMPLIGRLADLHGRAPVLLGCLLVFALGSLLTASSAELGVVVTGRLLQGVGGGGLVPVTLAVVADLWPADRRGVPLGVVGAVQELGSVAGPLYGAVVLAVSGWRAIFWVNVVVASLLALALVVVSRRAAPAPAGDAGARRPGAAVLGPALLTLSVGAAVLALAAPATLTTSVSLGVAYVPVVGSSRWATPLVLAAGLLLLLALSLPGPRRSLGTLLRDVDVPGAVLLSLALGTVVVAFAAADPARQVISDSGPVLLGAGAVALVLFVVRQRSAAHPFVPHGTLRPRGAWGSLLVNLFVGAALVAALVDIPVFARTTRYPDSQLGAALVLVQLLAALPVGALAGGWACRRIVPRVVAAGGMALATLAFVTMARWEETALDGPASTVALVAAGLGFGLALAPVNVALLAATRSDAHGVASALGIVARTMGMLVGLSVLTAIGLRVFYAEQRRIGTPLTLCPDSPGDCPAYDVATQAAVLSELSVIFWGAAACAGVAAVCAAALLRVPAATSETPAAVGGG